MWNEFDNYNSSTEPDHYNHAKEDSGYSYPPYYMQSQNISRDRMPEDPFHEPLLARRNSGRPNHSNAMPASPPPSYTPTRNASAFRVDSGSIRHCIGRFTYIWQDNGMEFWMFPIHVSRTTVTGFRWSHRLGWSYTGVSLNRIDSFICR